MMVWVYNILATLIPGVGILLLLVGHPRKWDLALWEVFAYWGLINVVFLLGRLREDMWP